MASTVQRLWIGIDWGTHSSKWWYSAETLSSGRVQPVMVPGVIDSTVYRAGDDLVISREGGRTNREIADAKLKRLLLRDPQGANYWDAVREGIGISLGEATALTIGSMLGDLFLHLKEAGLEICPNTEVHLRFSLPNWTGGDSEHRTARRRMYQASLVSIALIQFLGWDRLPITGARINIGQWRELVQNARCLTFVSNLIEKEPTTFADLIETEFSTGQFRWRLAAESSAAGYLPLERLLKEVPRSARTDKHWVKLLVVDVGAGSTDIGYFISSRRVDDRELLLNYLPPARTLDYAGEQLTEMLREFYWAELNRYVSLEEAEMLKLNAPERWRSEQFVKDWRERIARGVADYMFRVPDELRLAEPAIPGLKIVLTGGSGIVAGLDETIRNAVVESLCRRGVPGNVASRTEIVHLQPAFLRERVDAARRAVSIGAAQADFAYLAYRDKLDKAPSKILSRLD